MKHIEELEIEEFLQFLEDILYNSDQILQEIKLDGVQNISFHIDKDRTLYFGRQMKGEKVTWRKQSELPKTPIYNQFRSQTEFMIQFYNKNRQIFDEYISDDMLPFQVGCEIISQVYTNIIKFNIPETNHLVILNQIEPKMEHNKFKEFQNKLQQCDPITISFTQYNYKYDPQNYKIALEATDIEESWRISVQPQIQLEKYIQKIRDQLENKLGKIKQFLNSKPIEDIQYLKDLTQFEILNLRLNKVPKEYRQEVKQQKEQIEKQLREEFGEIKNLLLYYINKEVEEELKDYIEGIVFKYKNDQQRQAKLIDKEFFTLLNLEQWKYISHHPKYKEISVYQIIDQLKRKILSRLFVDSKQLEEFQKKQKELSLEDLQIYFYDYLTLQDYNYGAVLDIIKDEIQRQQQKQIEIYEDFEKNNYKIKVKHYGEEIEYDQSHMKYKIRTQLQEYIQLLKQMLRIQYRMDKSDIEKLQQILQMLFKQHSLFSDDEEQLKESYQQKWENLNQDSEIESEMSDSEYLDFIIILVEGGYVFKDTVPVKREDVIQIYEKFVEMLSSLGIKQPISVVGGQLTKKESGDIDIQQDIEWFVDNNYGTTIKEISENLIKKLAQQGIEQKKMQWGISIKFPYYFKSGNSVLRNNNKFVQIDFIIGNLEFLSEYLYQQEFIQSDQDPQVNEREISNKTQYKAQLRNVLQGQILNYHPNSSRTWEQDGYEFQEKYTLSFSGVRKIIRQRKKGQKTWKILKQEDKPEYTLTKILSDVLQRPLKFNDISTFENMLKIQQEDPELKKYSKEIQQYIKDFCEEEQIFCPIELMKQYGFSV